MNLLETVFNKKHGSFAEFEKVINSLDSPNHKGDAMEYFAYFYFTYFQEKYGIKEVYMEDNIPENIKEEIKLENTDYGVDGVFVTNNKMITAYQVKYRSSRERLTATDLATFWSESEYADQRLIFSNTYDLPQVAHKKKNQSSILLSELFKLDKYFFDALFNFYSKNIKIQEKKNVFSPRDHQEKMIDDILDGFEDKDRGKLIAACGTGKTLTAMWLHEEMESESVLYVVPSLSLIKQTLDSWRSHANQDFEFLCVCSDKTVTEFEDEINLSTSEVDFPVTTDPTLVSSFMNYKSEKKVVFVTYNSLDVIVSSCLETDFKFSLGIFDESHRTAGTKSAKMFTYGLYDEYIPIEKRLFMTATERLVSPRIRQNAEEIGEVVFSMDDKELYGPTLSTLNFGQAIEEDIINDYKIVLATIEEDELEEFNYSKTMLTTEIGQNKKITDKDVLLKQLILKKVLEDLNVDKIITYHSRVNNAKVFIDGAESIYPLSELLSSVNNQLDESIYFNHVNGEMSSGERSSIMQDFSRADKGLISNARVLTEGVDIPVIDAVYFVDPKNSLVDIVQAVGRALRKSDDKASEYSYVVIPMIIPKDTSMFNEFVDNDFSTIINVIQALRMQDNRLADQIDELNMSQVTGDYHKSNKQGNNNSILQVIPYDKLSIINFEQSLSLRVAQISEHIDSASKNNVVWEEKDARKSNVKRKLVSMGDYSMKSYEEKLIIPTLEKFINDGEIIPRKTESEIRFNNNNRSHTRRFGLIRKERKNYIITDLGKHFIEKGFTDFNKLARNQMLKYYSVNKDDKDNVKILFPYRTILKILKEVKYLTRLEFLYSIYHLQSTDENDIEKAIETVYEIRQTYPNIEQMNVSNQEKILNLLNSKWDVNYSYIDIWSSKTTTYNQFNYFKNHLSLFKDILDEASDGSVLKIKDGSENKIEEALSMYEDIEYFSYADIDKLEEYYRES